MVKRPFPYSLSQRPLNSWFQSWPLSIVLNSSSHNTCSSLRLRLSKVQEADSARRKRKEDVEKPLNKELTVPGTPPPDTHTLLPWPHFVFEPSQRELLASKPSMQRETGGAGGKPDREPRCGPLHHSDTALGLLRPQRHGPLSLQHRTSRGGNRPGTLSPDGRPDPRGTRMTYLLFGVKKRTFVLYLLRQLERQRGKQGQKRNVMQEIARTGIKPCVKVLALRALTQWDAPYWAVRNKLERQ